MSWLSNHRWRLVNCGGLACYARCHVEFEPWFKRVRFVSHHYTADGCFRIETQGTPVTTELQQLEAAIAGLEAQRALLGDAVVDLATGSLRSKLAALTEGAGAASSAATGPAAASPPAEQTLKQVSVLFLDVVGSTTLAQHLDPEDIHAVMDGTLAACTALVEARHGRVLQYAGDNLLAVFGADEAQEDDAERAVRTGLALLLEGKRRGEAVLLRHGHAGFDVRVGIHTGGVLLGGGVDAGGSIRGLTVNIAARMEQTAPAGALRISHATYAQVRGVFDVEPQAPIEVKGVDEPIATWLVLRAKPRAFRVVTRGIEGVATRMVGRDTELARLQQAFQRVCNGGDVGDAGHLTIVTVVAEAGVGKSRLLYEFQNWAEAQAASFYLFQGRAHPQTRSQPYGLLRDVLAWRFEIADSDSMEAAKRKLEDGLVPLFSAADGTDRELSRAQAQAHLLGHLIGLDFADSPHVKGILQDGRQVRNRAFHAAAQMFRRIAQAGTGTGTGTGTGPEVAAAPIVLLLDDLHWADDGSLDFLAFLFAADRDVPMLVLGLTRPELFERRAGWPGASEAAGGFGASGTSGAQRIDLAPLDTGLSRALADELLQRLPEVPFVLRELITSGAEGNPFYMEELVKMLIEEGAIVTGADGWHVNPDKLLAAHVPSTLTGVLQARLDGVKPAEKLALQQAAVIGFVFWDQALAAIDAHATESLPGVARRALVIPRPDAGVDGVREFTFNHQILHHVTYDTVLKRVRRGYHAAAAGWLAGLTGARANDFLGLAAEHFEKAGDTDRACEFYARAAEHAGNRYAHEAVLGYVAQALGLMEASDDRDGLDARQRARLRWRLLDARECTLGLQGRRAEQRDDIAALDAVAEDLDDDVLRFEVAWRRCDIALRIADYRAVEAAARQALQIALRTPDRALVLRARLRIAIALGEQGDWKTGEQLAEAGLTEARALGLRRIETLFLNALSVAAGVQDDLMRALHIDQQKVLIDRELGNLLNEAITVGNIGESWLQLGAHAQARIDLDEGLRLTRAVGNRAMECIPLLNLTQLVLREGDAALALAHAQTALHIGIEVQNPEHEARALCHIGHAELALGHIEAAALAFERGRTAALAADTEAQHDAAAGIAKLALAQGDAAAAMAVVEGLLAHLAGGGTLVGTDGPRLILLTCHQVLAGALDPRAVQVLGEAHAGLMAIADAITDEGLRASFLDNIPEHRQIVAAWAAQQCAAPMSAIEPARD